MEYNQENVPTTISIRPNIHLAYMLEDFKTTEGYRSYAQAVEACIRMAHSNKWPGYNSQTQSPSQKLLNKTLKNRAIKNSGRKTPEMIEQEQIQICEVDLNGEVVTDSQGNKVCRFYTYDRTERFEQEYPLNMLNEETPDYQYQPSREKVEELQKAGKVDYEYDIK